MKKIMIVDDEQISLMMTNHILSSEYSTVCVSSGAEAIALYNREKPDMVLSDLRMPGMTGYELQKELQTGNKEQIPFMFMTADTDADTESKGFENGALDFIRKPFRADILLKRVANILQTVEKIQGLKKAAVMDPMTGLLNKASSEFEISQLCQSAKGALLMIDLDSFKLVNDIHGHAMGDKILITFAEILRAVVRPIDVVGRLGGDEFIAFCQHVSDESVIEKKSLFINEHISQAAKEFLGQNTDIPLGASIGCVFVPEEGTDFKELHKKADKALYDVKKNGKHGYKCYKEDVKKESLPEKNAGGLSNAIQILSERNKSKGAMNLSFEHFRTLFQFNERLRLNYQKEFCLILFELKEKSSGRIPPEEVSEKFLKLLVDSLRQSDGVTASKGYQFLVLLPETPVQNLNFVVARIRQGWIQKEESARYEISFEHTVME